MCADKINPESREDTFRALAQLHQDQLLGAIGKVAKSTEDMRALAEDVFSEKLLSSIKSSFRWFILFFGIVGPAIGLFSWLWLTSYFVTNTLHDASIGKQVDFNQKAVSQFRSMELLMTSNAEIIKEHERRLSGMEADIKEQQRLLQRK